MCMHCKPRFNVLQQFTATICYRKADVAAVNNIIQTRCCNQVHLRMALCVNLHIYPLKSSIIQQWLIIAAKRILYGVVRDTFCDALLTTVITLEIVGLRLRFIP